MNETVERLVPATYNHTMATDEDKHVRPILPIADVCKSRLTAFDAKDPESSFAPIEPMIPP